MRYGQYHYGPGHELRMWAQLFTHWSTLFSIAFVAFVFWLLLRIGRQK